MSIITLHTLNEKQREEINQLIIACNEYDKLKRLPVLEEEDNYYPELKSYYCFYQKNVLVSVLILYQPFPDEAEISAYTLPSYRRQGYFKSLYVEAIKELKKYHISIAVLVVENNSISGKACAEALKAKSGRSDYLMSYELKLEMSYKEYQEIFKEKYTVVQLTKNNLVEGTKVFQEIFEWEHETVQEMMGLSLKDSGTQTFLLCTEGTAIGTLSLHLGSMDASIYGFGINKKYRGKGFGKAFLVWTLSALKDMGREKVVLQVESESMEAFQLYKNFGFTILEQYDYHYKKI
jgi:ribosomal protein S18 acetylase RimI-like enzyme